MTIEKKSSIDNQMWIGANIKYLGNLDKKNLPIRSWMSGGGVCLTRVVDKTKPERNFNLENNRQQTHGRNFEQTPGLRA